MSRYVVDSIKEVLSRKNMAIKWLNDIVIQQIFIMTCTHNQQISEW